MLKYFLLLFLWPNSQSNKYYEMLVCSIKYVLMHLKKNINNTNYHRHNIKYYIYKLTVIPTFTV